MTNMSGPRLVLLLVCTAGLYVVPAAAQPKCICYQKLPTSLVDVTEIEAPPDGSGRLFISEHAGLIHIMDSSETLLSPPFMNLTVIATQILSIAFHPDYANNHRFYVYYSTGPFMHLSEFFTNSTDPNQADVTSERLLMEIPDGNTHKGGDLLFGVDGMMYIFLGDGSNAGLGDPMNNSQTIGNKHGTVLRIDVDTRSGNLEYGIPADNPFISDPAAANNTEVYAYGLRNPWRATMDVGDRVTQAGRGRVFIADVGEAKWEEIDLLQAGANYGWAAREGPECYKDLLNCPDRPVCVTDATETCPLMSYDHNSTGQCIIGGHVYRGCVNVDYNGWYFFADYKTPNMFRMIESSPDVWEMAKVPTCASCSAQDFLGVPYTIGMDGNGELYLSTARPDGIYKMYDPEYVGTPPCPLP